MDNTVFVGEITEWELKKRLDLKIQKLQKQRLETGGIDLENTNQSPIDDLLNNLAYRCVECGLSESVIKSEIQKIMEQKPSEELVDESVVLDESWSTEQSLSKSDGSFNFNDTMEEMEKLLKEGLASTSDNDEDNKCAVESGSETLDKPEESDIQFEEIEDENVSAIEVEQLSCNYSKNFENEQLTSSEKSIESKTSDADHVPFKLPSSSKKQILNSNGNNKPQQIKISTHTNKLYKDIVSPVAFYIKNSGVTPTRQKLNFTPERHLFRNDFTDSIYCTSDSNNHFPLAKEIVLPEVLYTPASKIIISQKYCTKIPNSINKLVGDRPEIIIHEHRIKKGERNPKTHTINPMYSIVNEDISIYVTKQAEIH